ncbi:MAG: hypothetical protein KAG89_10395 [Fulvimarina manganoxydans]|uniref:hypothetical protein n=1 Tax=Fulvimarina manganoxydans TaxID=937218 RepID=UPI002353FDE0|nr:hypothetical protein [Fulvimarina manganoxydans]MCK5932565.1 hypothetical protein [Fulvimarina manganoxydans]
MRARAGLATFGLIAAASSLSACQAFGPEEETSVGALRLSAAQPVASSQRLDEDGYPLLGAYPGAAAPQLSEAEVASADSRLNQVAASRTGTGGATGYDAKIASLKAIRDRRVSEAEAALATQPRPSRTTGRGPRPEDVLREIESSQ